MASEMRLICAALEKIFLEVLAQLVVMVKCSANCSLFTVIKKAQEVLESIAAETTSEGFFTANFAATLRRTSWAFSLREVPPDTHDLAKLKRVDQATEQARVELERLAIESLDDAAARKTEASRLALDRCVELAICDMSAANKGEPPMRSRLFMACRTWKMNLKDLRILDWSARSRSSGLSDT